MLELKFERISLKEHAFLSFFKELFTEDECEICLPLDGANFSRQACDGIIQLIGRVGYQRVGVVFNDFRVNGGSFGSENSQRTIAFFEHMRQSDTPVIMILNTLGVRFMEGRTVFQNTFGLVPTIAKFAAENLLITISSGRTLGLGALLFGLGHYRIATREDSLINLTGPEVINLFFGRGFDYKAASSPEALFLKTDLVHELADDRQAALARAHDLMSAISLQSVRAPSVSSLPNFQGEHFDPSFIHPSEEKLEALLSQIDGGCTEIFHELSSIVRTYIGVHGKRLVGIFANPPGHPGNIINSRALEKYSIALDFFKTLGLPIVSFLDTAGAEPRTISHESGLIGKFVTVAQKIIEYPHPKMGFVTGRCFGGATVLGFPKIFGGESIFALASSQIGVMHEDIISRLLSGSPRLLEKWQGTAATQLADLSDLIVSGAIDGLISEDEIGAKLTSFLLDHQASILTAELLEKSPRRHQGRNLKQDAI